MMKIIIKGKNDFAYLINKSYTRSYHLLVMFVTGSAWIPRI